MTKSKNPDTIDNKEYQKLRKEGMDKEKAARIVNYTGPNKKSKDFPDEDKEEE